MSNLQFKMKKKGSKADAAGKIGVPAESKLTKIKQNRKGQYEIKPSEDPFLRGLSA